MCKKRGAYRVFVGKLEGRRSPGRPRRRWEDKIKMDLREMAQDKDKSWVVVNAVMNLRVP
jgi:hypothetical protein